MADLTGYPEISLDGAKVIDVSSVQGNNTGDNDNPGAKSQGMKQLMAGGGVALIGSGSTVFDY